VHSLLDRSTILAGLVDELRPLLPPLGGALGDLCAGFGHVEAAEQALETAFMIRAAAEMLELDALSEAGRLVEELVPLISGAPPALLKEALPVVQSLMAALEQATDALVGGKAGPEASLEAARSGLERLRLGRRQVEALRQTPSLDLDEMLATLPEPAAAISAPTPDGDDAVEAEALAPAEGGPVALAEAELLEPVDVPPVSEAMPRIRARQK
jgi:hypothetical protein